MAATVSVTIDRAALSRFLTAPGHDVHQYMSLVILNRVRNAAMARCPVDTGRLRSSITVHGPVAAGATNLIGTVGTDVEYAGFVHEGTRYMRGRPFLTDALTEVIG